MWTCRLTVRTPEGVWQGDVGSWTGLVVLASLSAEPESFPELTEAVRRYQPEHELFQQPRRTPACGHAEADEPWCLIDLVGRTVLAGGGLELPEPNGAYQADEEDEAEGFPVLWLDTPPDWVFQEADDDWQLLVASRAVARSAAARIDARAVLFGRPVLEHLADGVLASSADGVPNEDRRYDLTRSIHASWLMTARPDLAGRTPREVLLADCDRISRDIERRSQQWSMQRQPAPALSRDSAAYRLGGFGTIEVVLYFDMVRALLAEAWGQVKARPTRGELIKHLEEFRDHWLHQPCEGSSSLLTPSELIDSERRRMPITSDGHFHPDDDCPLCQAMADGEFGPSFLCFDGHHLELEDEFAFSLCRTREEWDEQQEDYRKFAEEIDRKAQERKARGEDEAGSVWKRSHVNWGAMSTSSEQGMLALGFLLAELTSDLQPRPDGAEW